MTINYSEPMNNPVNEQINSHLKTISEEDFEVFIKRKDLAMSSPTFIDPRIIETLDLINSFSGVSTVWSCSGHTKEEYETQYDPEYIRDTDSWYIVYVIKEGDNQAAFLQEVIKEWQAKWNPRWQANNKIFILHEELEDGLLWDGIIDREGFYPCCHIRMRFTNNDASHATIVKMYEDFNMRLRVAINSFLI